MPLSRLQQRLQNYQDEFDLHRPPRMVASVTSGENTDNDNDIEGGSYSSTSDDEHVPVSKSVSTGRFSRRLSQELNLSNRRRSRDSLVIPAESKRNNEEFEYRPSGSFVDMLARSRASEFEYCKKMMEGGKNEDFPLLKKKKSHSDSAAVFAKIVNGNAPSSTPARLVTPALSPASSPISFRRAQSAVGSYAGGPIKRTMVPNMIHIQNDCLPVIHSQCGEQSSSSSRITNSKFYKFSLLAIFLLACTTIYQQCHLISLQTDLESAQNTERRLTQLHEQTSQELFSAKETMSTIKSNLSAVNQHVKQIEKEKEELMENESKGEKVIQGLRKKNEITAGRMDGIIKGIQERSRRAVIEKYGEGPHIVQLQVQLPDVKYHHTIDIELAPLDLMPHSVHTFLEQVDFKAWDGTQFDLHAGHVLLARPTTTSSNEEEHNNKKAVPVVSFPEYSTQYPHDQYTVAFPGKPGNGQDFYINLTPNTPYHSPRMTPEGGFVEGEPCFGKIVNERSRRVVDVIDRLNIIEEGVNKGVLETPVTILSAIIVS